MDGLLPFFELVAVDARMRELKVKNVGVGPAGQGLVKIWISQSDGRAPVPGSTDLQDLDGRLRFLAETGEPHFTASFGPIAAGETKSEPFFEEAGFNDTLQHLVGVPVDAYFVINYEDVFHRPFHVHKRQVRAQDDSTADLREPIRPGLEPASFTLTPGP